MTDSDLELAKRDMLRRQLQQRGIRDRSVLAAMEQVPREQFLPESLRPEAYADRALGIECGQTISQPYMVALMTQALSLSPAHRVLEIGTGSGYQAAILAQLAAEVVSIERHAELSLQAAAVLTRLGYANVTLRIGDGSLGCPDRSPFDRIVVTAAAAQCPPALIEQLAVDGILVIPLGSRSGQILELVQKRADGLLRQQLVECRFVPLIGAQAWPE